MCLSREFILSCRSADCHLDVNTRQLIRSFGLTKGDYRAWRQLARADCPRGGRRAGRRVQLRAGRVTLTETESDSPGKIRIVSRRLPVDSLMMSCTTQTRRQIEYTSSHQSPSIISSQGRCVQLEISCQSGQESMYFCMDF